MPYLGVAPNPRQNREVDDISSGFNGGTTAFTLQAGGSNVSPGSDTAIIVSLGGVIQNPGTDYTIAASTITFTTAPASGLTFFGVVLAQSVDIETPADGTVTTSKIVDDAVTAAKLASNSVVSDSIVNGSIVNADINASAAIAKTKIETFVNNNGSTRFITGTNNVNELDAESNLTVNGSLITFSSSTLVVDKSTSPTISVKETAGNKEAQFRADTTGGLLRTVGSYPLVFGVNQAEEMRLDTSGRLLIGHSTGNGFPQLSVSGNTAGASGAGMLFLRRGLDRATIGSNVGADLGEVDFGDLDGNIYASIQGKTDAATGSNDFPGRIILATTADGGSSPAERVRIDSSGRVGINATPSEHNSAADDLVIKGTNVNTGITIMTTNGGLNTSVVFSDGTSGGADFQGAVQYLHNGDHMRFLVAQNEKARLNGNGLSFNGDTAAANALNDYEEGTFTGGFNDFNGTYSANTGTYTKIGNLVHVTIRVAGSGGSGSGALILTSLPFNSEGTPSDYRAVGSVHAQTGLVTGGLQVVGVMNNNINKVNIRGINNNAGATNLNRNGLNSSGFEVMITITYQTAA